MFKSCYFCQQKTDEVDEQNFELLRRFISSQAKILPPKRTGLCAKHQRKIAKTIKRARVMGLLPFTIK